MDMKKILQALDGASEKPAVDSNDMKKFLTIVEGKGSLNQRTSSKWKKRLKKKGYRMN